MLVLFISRPFEKNYIPRILVHMLSHVDVTRSHQAHVLYFSLHDIAKVSFKSIL